MDLVDLFRPGSTLTWRKLGVLVHQLPPESATVTIKRVEAPQELLERASGGSGPDPADSQWSKVEVLLATVVDELRYLRHTYVSAHAKTPPRPPEPVPRPGVRRDSRQRMTVGTYRRLTGQEPPERLINREG